MKIAISVLASAILLCGTTAFGQSKNGADMTKEIQDFCQQHDNTWNTKGAVTVAKTFFAEDVVFVPPDGAVVKGNEALAKVWGDIYKEPTVIKCTVGGAHAEGDGAWAYGEVTITGNPAGHLRWTAFDIKQNDQWKVQMLHVTPIKE
jgi:ketosteroid isomerase-like protein